MCHEYPVDAPDVTLRYRVHRVLLTLPSTCSATDSIGYSAKELAKGVRGTAKLISQLGELARRKALFNDPSAEINELTGVVKRHLGAQKQQLAQLAQQMGARAGRAVRRPHARQHLFAVSHTVALLVMQRTAHERGHWSQVVEMLKQQIVRNATDFQAALRVRTRTIKELAARRGRFSSSKFAPPPPMATPLFARPVHRPALGERESDGSGGGRSIGVGSGGPPPTSAFGARQGPPVGVAPPSTARPGPGVDDSRGAQPSGGLRHRGGAADASAEQPSLYSGAGPGFGSGQIVGFEQARSRASEAQQVESTIVEVRCTAVAQLRSPP